MPDDQLLQVSGLNMTYGGRRGVQVVRDVSFSIARGEVLALVGESGSGKTTVARGVVGSAPFTGDVLFGPDRQSLRMRRTHDVRRRIPMVFQDPRSSLNPRMTVESIIREVWATHPSVAPATDRRLAINDLLARVGLDEAVADRRPAQLSGGQCQRVSIARALALQPDLIVCDEAVSALDVSVQAQVLRLLLDLKRSQNIAMLFITHDLGVVRQIADSVAVMQRGEIVEYGLVEDVYRAPQHPYTRELFESSLDLADEQ